jgi:hypothetical protein
MTNLKSASMHPTHISNLPAQDGLNLICIHQNKSLGVVTHYNFLMAKHDFNFTVVFCRDVVSCALRRATMCLQNLVHFTFPLELRTYNSSLVSSGFLILSLLCTYVGVNIRSFLNYSISAHTEQEGRVWTWRFLILAF